MPQSPTPVSIAQDPALAFKMGKVDGQGNLLVANSAATGRAIFVNESTGDDANPGTAAAPVATLTAALALATANQNDVVYFSGTIHVTATVAWNKNGVSLVGLTSPSNNCRARISSSGSTVFTPMVNVTANGCSFVNVGTFYGYVDAVSQVCWTDGGGRNYYENCQFQGVGNETGADQAGARAFTITGGNGENQFVNCRFGVDTVARGTTGSATLEFIGGAPRNIFRGCVFSMLSAVNTNVHVKAGSAAMDRYQIFDDCLFVNAIESTGTAITQAFSVAADAGGLVLLSPTCLSIGATNWASAGPVYGGSPVPSADTSGIAIAMT